MNTKTQILEKLNTYTGDNIWEDVIRGLPEYDDAATDAADPNYDSDIVVLTDGTEINYDEQRGIWR